MAETWEKYFDLEAFQNEIKDDLFWVSSLYIEELDGWVGAAAGAAVGGAAGAGAINGKAIDAAAGRESSFDRENYELLVRTQNQAKEVTRQKTVLDHLCPALLTLSGDAFEIAKCTAPILLTLAFAGTIAIPLYPPFFAGVAVLISRMGIATLCADYDKDKEKK